MPEESQIPVDSLRRQSTAQVVQGIIQFLRVVRHRKNIVIVSLVITLLLGALYYCTATPYYQASASVNIMQTGSDMRKTELSSDSGLMPTYKRLLTSEVVLKIAAEKLAPEDRIDLKDVAPHQWADALRYNLTADIIRNTRIIDVSYRSKSPHAAAAVVRAVVNAYLDDMNSTHQNTALEIKDIFENQLTKINQRLAEKKSLLGQLKLKHRYIDYENSQKLSAEKTTVLELNTARIEAQKKRLAIQSMLHSLEDAIRNGDDLQQYILSLEGAVGRAYLLATLGIGDADARGRMELEREVLRDRAERRTMIEFYGRRHPQVMEINDRIRLTEGYLADYHNRVKRELAKLRQSDLEPLLVNMVQQKLNEAWNHEKALTVSFQQAEQVALEIDSAKQELTDLLAKVHDLKLEKETITNRIADIVISKEHGTIRAKVTDEPKVPTRPVSPKLSLITLLCLVFGTSLGMGIIYIMDIIDDHFRSPDEMRTYLDTTILAMVRQLHPSTSQGFDAIQIHSLPDAIESEAFRTLRTTLAFSGRQTSRIVVSSAEPGDGKTTVLVNLATANAQAGLKTLLIDADLRCPGLTALLDMKRQQGLSDLLRYDEIDVDAERLVVSTPIEHLDVLPAGLRRSNPSELLASPAMEELLVWAEARYDQILIDCPPALAASDCSIVGQLVDGAILVVQPTKNRRQIVVRAAEAFTSVNVELLGVVINRVDDGESTGYYGYGSAYGYGHVDEEAPTQATELVAPRKAG